MIKTHPRASLEKRLCLEGVKPLKLMTVTQFHLFFQKPRAPNMESKWKPNGASRHSKSKKKQEKRTLKNT